MDYKTYVVGTPNVEFCTPTFCKESINMDIKTQTFSGRRLFYPNFQNLNEPSEIWAMSWENLCFPYANNKGAFVVQNFKTLASF